MIRSEAPSDHPRTTWLDRSRAAPFLAGLITAVVSWWVWGFSADPLAMIQDENAYRLQASLFARGRWADPMPPAERFFDQVHVLSHPVRAAKYPPGHSLALAPGFLAGVPVAWPLLCDFASASLLFALARRASGGAVALLAWIVWLTSPGELYVRSTFFSELTTALLWLLGWWALLKWKDGRRAEWLLLFGLCAGWQAITRPLTALAFAIPAGIAALVVSARRRSWRPLAGAILVGAAVVLLWPIWSAETTGDARVSPLALYTREVLPWDRPGFGLRDGPARFELGPDLRGEFLDGFRALHARHTPGNLPSILRRRLLAVAKDVWGPQGWPLCAFALFGILVSPREARVAWASTALLFLFHLSYAHFANWTVYYVEVFGVLSYATALGLWRGFRLLATRAGLPAFTSAGPWLLAAGLAAAGAPALVGARERREIGLHDARIFAEALARLPPGPSVVFVRYGPRHDPHRSLIVNGPGLASARLWIVYDRGTENARLLASAEGRSPYLYDEATHRLEPLGAP